MAKKTAPEAGSEQKVMTKYDLKMEIQHGKVDLVPT